MVEPDRAEMGRDAHVLQFLGSMELGQPQQLVGGREISQPENGTRREAVNSFEVDPGLAELRVGCIDESPNSRRKFRFPPARREQFREADIWFEDHVLADSRAGHVQYRL